MIKENREVEKKIKKLIIRKKLAVKRLFKQIYLKQYVFHIYYCFKARLPE